MRGERVMIVDPVRIDGDRFTTSLAPAPTANGLRVSANTLTAADVKEFLLGLTRKGIYAVVSSTDDKTAWATFPAPNSTVDLFWTTFKSLFVSALYLAESHGTIAIPIRTDQPFTIEGADAATGFRMFSRSYPPSSGGPIEGPNPDTIGPYPVSISPGRVEIVDLVASEVSLRELRFKLAQDGVTFEYDSRVPAELRTPAGASVQVVNLNNGSATYAAIASSGSVALPRLPAVRNDRLLLLSGVDDVSSLTSEIAIDFSEAITILNEADWPRLFRIESIVEGRAENITAGCTFRIDGAQKRVSITPPGQSLRPGAQYRVTMRREISDFEGNALAQVGSGENAPASSRQDLVLVFKVRDVVPPLSEFNLVPSTLHPSASLVDFAQHGNLLFVSALDGGILAYDISNPDALRPRDNVQPKPLAIVPGRWSNPAGTQVTPGFDEHWAITTDRHGRVYSTGFSGPLSLLRTYSVDDFIAARDGGECSAWPDAPANALCHSRSSTIIGWRPGSTATGLAGELLSDRVEAIPRRIQILTQDDERTYDSREAFKTALEGNVTAVPLAGDPRFERMSIRLTERVETSEPHYLFRRVTIVNLTRDLSWSIDVPTDGGAVTLNGVLAAESDSLAIIRNISTQAIVTQYGFGITIFDVNAIESSDRPNRPSTYKVLREQIVSTRADLASRCATDPAMEATPKTLLDASLSGEAALIATPQGIVAFTTVPSRGILGFGVDMVKAAQVAGTERECIVRGPGLIVYDEATGEIHPRLAPIKQKAEQIGRVWKPRYRSIATVRGKVGEVSTTFLLVAAGDLGVLVFNAGAEANPLIDASTLSSVIWIPDGAMSIRVSQEMMLASVVDGAGHVSVVRLDDLDERAATAQDALFATALRAISAGPARSFGVDDARVLWKSTRPLVTGSMPPILDVDTGLLFSGDTFGTRMQASVVIDPEVRVLDASASKFTVVDAITPLGVPPAARQQPGNRPSSAEGVFRLEVTMPGSVNETAASQELQFKVSSERIEGVPADASPAGLPAASADVILRRSAPVDSSQPALRFQKGFNRWMSDPLIAIADLRASEDFPWPAGTDVVAARRDGGCLACERPAVVTGDDTAQEILSAGRVFHIKPVASSGALAQLAAAGRLERRVRTIPTDIVRDVRTQIAAQAPPVAAGLLQETTYMHSGEVETSAVDLDAGGRAGWNVIVDRTYRSRMIGLSPLALGWDSTIFRRLRVLPNDDVEYRDGRGEVWTFRKGNAYAAPAGLSLKLVKREDGRWSLLDQQSRLFIFDAFGRLSAEADEFYDGKPGSGNVVHYLYGADGRLARIVDPVGRETTLTYDNQGNLHEVSDWRGREVTYEYDLARRLHTVKLPEVGLYTGDARPTVRYGYQSEVPRAREVGALLAKITDPGGDEPRVSFEYELSGNNQDRVLTQTWATGETASFTWDSATEATSIDVMGQRRKYTLVAPAGDRPHVAELKEEQVPVWTGAEFGHIPSSVSVNTSATAVRDRVHRFTYEHGMLKSAKSDGVIEVTNTLAPAPGGRGHLLTEAKAAALVGTDALMPVVEAITTKWNYQQGSAFLAAVEKNGALIESLQPHRDRLDPVSTNDSISAASTYDAHGQLVAMNSSGGTDSGSAGAASVMKYHAEDAAEPFVRGLLDEVTDAEGLTITSRFEYPDAFTLVEIDARGTRTTTVVDEWQRPVSIDVTQGGKTLHRSFTYDAAGRLVNEKTRKDDVSGDVTTTYTYDAVGRQLTATVDKVAVEGGTLKTSTSYDLANRKVTTTSPGGAITVTTLDNLGRPKKKETLAGTTSLDEQFAYDLAGNTVFTADNFTAQAAAFDAHGRLLATRHADGTASAQEWDAWGNVKASKQFDSGAAVVAEMQAEVSAAGRLKELRAKIDELTTRSTQFAWDGAGRSTASVTGNRSSRSAFDTVGRLKSALSGVGTLGSVTEAFETTTVTSHDGLLPATTTTAEKDAAPVTATAAYGVGGEVTSQKIGSLEWKQSYNGLGAVTTASVPGRPEQTFETDSTGAVTSQKLEDGESENRYQYAPSGALKDYIDPTAETTAVVNDQLGRPLRRTYPDGTTDEIEWEGARIRSVVDRQARKRWFEYDASGRLWRVRGANSQLLEERAYDSAGRLVSWKNGDVELTYHDFDFAGHPRKTRQHRFKASSGFSSMQVLDVWEQEHRWNAHGERVNWSMPRYQGFTPGESWTDWIKEEYDAMGNVVLVGRTRGAGGQAAAVLQASYRNSGRPVERAVFAGAGIGSPASVPIILRSYGYDAATSQMNRMSVAVDGVEIAGSEVKYDGLQVSEARLLGVSDNQRVTKWKYDLRSRLQASLVASLNASAIPDATETRGSAREKLTKADFREAQARTSHFDEATRGVLQGSGVDLARVEPPSIALVERAGHKIDRLTRGAEVRNFAYDGAEVVDDGRFRYEFDAYGRLIRATEKGAAPKRRILYYYTPAGRVAGRRAEQTTASDPQEDDWRLEDRTTVLKGDGLPPETTFIWDPISDRIVSVAVAGASSSLAHGGLRKQVIHGGLGYDDPIEIASVDSLAPGEALSPAPVKRLYPIYDESATGMMQAVIGQDGAVVARNIPADPFGGEDVVIAGPVVDRISVSAAKSETGVLAHVTVTLGTTEPLTAATITSGVRLAAVDAQGNAVATSDAVPTLVDASTNQPPQAGRSASTLRWKLTPEQWQALATAPGATALSIAATNTLRAETFGPEAPVLPPPDWAAATRPVFTDRFPIELRESLASLSAFLAGIPAGEERSSKLYEIESLELAGTSEGQLFEETFSAAFHAYPFTDAATGKVYARARWYDPQTGTFLTPDPLGYVDSSNLYAFAGGDPVNGRDPRGEDAYDERLRGYIRWYSDRMGELDHRYRAAQAAYKRAVASDNDVGTAVAELNALEMQRSAFGGSPENAATYFEFARSKRDGSALVAPFDEIHAKVVADEGVKAMGAAVVAAGMPVMSLRATLSNRPASPAPRRAARLTSRPVPFDELDAGYGQICQKSSGRLGKEGEARGERITGGKKNTETFRVDGRDRIPDFVLAQDVATRLPTKIAEIKNVMYQALTRQLRDYAKLAGPGGLVEVLLPPWARVSKNLQNQFNSPTSPLVRRDLVEPQ